ncbi:MAG: PHD finger domain-containing protein [Thermomicrobiales bacterium]
MPRICPVCAGRIEDSERFQECSVCHRNYHLDHRCPEHPRANMLVISPSQIIRRPEAGQPASTRTTIFRPIQSPTTTPTGQRPRIPAPVLTPQRDYRKPIAAGTALVVVLAILAIGVLTPIGLPFVGSEADPTRPAGGLIRERSTTQEDDAEVSNPPRTTDARDQESSAAIAMRDAREEIAELKFGPDAGRLTIGPDATAPGTLASGVRLRDPMIRVRLFTPSEAERAWDYGITFRRTDENREYRLIMTSDKVWYCDLIDGDSSQPVSRQSGRLTGVDTEAGEHNDLHLIAIGDVGYFFINERYVATLDLSEKMEAGDVTIGAGFLPAHRSPGQSADFQDFEIAARSPRPSS